jgi:VWFA-related protein
VQFLDRRRILWTLGGLWGWGAAGQQRPTFSADVKVINVLATVTNKRGEIVRDLGKDAFLLEEDGRPQTIRYFSRDTDLPLTLGLLVDTSLSQRRLLEQERQAAHRFFDRVLRPAVDLAFVIRFDFEVELLQDLTPDRARLEKALGLLELPRFDAPRRQPGQGPGLGPGQGPLPRQGPRPGPGQGPGQGGRRGGGTALYDAALLASDELMKKQSGRKALILLSDGVDTGSKVSLASAIESAQRADTLVYAVLFSDPRGNQPMRMGGPMGRGGGRGRGQQRPPMRQLPDGKKVLERLARETGGGFFEVSKKQPVEKVFDRIQDELRQQYNLGYVSDAADAGGGYRRIRLTAKDRSLVVRARDGYYPRAGT